MKTTDILRAIDNDIYFIAHYNTKGSHWYKQGEGKRYQAHAKYAMGKPNPDAKDRADTDTFAKVLAKNVPNFNSEKAKGEMRHETVKVKFSDKTPESYRKMMDDRYGNGYMNFRSLQLKCLTGGVNVWADHKKQISVVKLDTNMKNPAEQFGMFRLRGDTVDVYGYGKEGVVKQDLSNKALNRMKDMIEKGSGGSSRYPMGQSSQGTKGIVDKVKTAASDAALKYHAKNDAAYHLVSQDLRKTKSKGYRRLATLARLDKNSYDGYVKRGEGTLAGTKLTSREKKLYKDTFNKYWLKYFDATKVDYGKMYWKKDFDTSKVDYGTMYKKFNKQS